MSGENRFAIFRGWGHWMFILEKHKAIPALTNRKTLFVSGILDFFISPSVVKSPLSGDTCG